MDDAEPKTKKIWVRVGMTVSVTEDELKEMMRFAESCSMFPNSFTDYDISEETARRWLKNAVVDGDSYIPGDCFDEHRDWYRSQKSQGCL